MCWPSAAEFLPTEAQARRAAAGEAAGSGRPLSILPRSEAHIRREAVAKIRAKEEVDAILRRAADARVKAEAEARAAEQARKAAEAKRAAEVAAERRELEVRRAAHKLACERTVVIRATLPKDLSANSRNVFALLVTRYTDAGRKPVKLTAADAAKAFDIREDAARTAINDLRTSGLAVDVVDGVGVSRLMPAASAVAAVTEGRAS